MMLGNDDFEDLAEILRGSDASSPRRGRDRRAPGRIRARLVRLLDADAVGHAARAARGGAGEPDRRCRRRHPRSRARGLQLPLPADRHAPRPGAEARRGAAGRSVDAAGLRVGPVGSRAVREAIEKTQPLLGLHGHVHESPGAQKLGRTLCVNPGLGVRATGFCAGRSSTWTGTRACAGGRSSRASLGRSDEPRSCGSIQSARASSTPETLELIEAVRSPQHDAARAPPRRTARPTSSTTCTSTRR